MVTIRPFEPGRFSSAAQHYLKGRAPYAPRLIARVAERVGLGPEHRVLDLGCGPAQLACAFAPMVAEVVAADPADEMLDVARGIVPANVRLLRASSYDLGPDFGRLRLVVMGRSFHWMDRAETLRRLDALIEPGGAVALFGDTHPRLPDNAWVAAFDALIDAHAVRDEIPAAQWVRHEALLLESAFPVLEEISITERRRIPADMLLDRALSISATAPARLGDRLPDFVAAMRALLRRIAPEGWLTEVVASYALIATRP